MANNFEQMEDGGRLDWLHLNARDIVRGRKLIAFTRDPFCPVDFYMTAYTKSAATMSVGEIKKLRRDLSKYPNFQIDYKKVVELQKEAKRTNSTPLLCCFFTDWTYVWDLTDFDPESTRHTSYCPSTTADNPNDKVEKEEVYLEYKDALWKEERWF